MTVPNIAPTREQALESALRSVISFLNPDTTDEIEHFVLGLAKAALAMPPDPQPRLVYDGRTD
jgi:hypothetical protein